MIRLTSILVCFFSLSILCPLYGQMLSMKQKITLDSLLYDSAFDASKAIIEKLRKETEEESIDQLWLLSRNIAISEQEKNIEESIKWMKKYTNNQFAIDAYDKDAHIKHYNEDAIPFSSIQFNMPDYHRRMVWHLIEKGEYEEGLKYLKIQRDSYPFNFPCTVGIVDDKEMEFISLSSIIHFNLENYDTVINLLLPYNFKDKYGIFKGREEVKTELDSLLYLALRADYSDREILEGLNECIDETLSRRPSVGLFDPLLLRMFGREVKMHVNGMYYDRKVRDLRLRYENLEISAVDELVDEIYNEMITDAIKSMRIYQYVESK